MNLSLYTGGVKPYLEYGWVCAPNTAGQSITANTITTLTIDTEVADTGGFGSIASNQITLADGTYYYEAITSSGSAAFSAQNLGLLNVTDGAFISRLNWHQSGYPSGIRFTGQFTISASKAFSLLYTSSSASQIGTGANATAFGTVTAGGGVSSGLVATSDQRTTLKLWKLA